jgi:uncharacterized membrane protein YbhN (UPF0104 family)
VLDDLSLGSLRRGYVLAIGALLAVGLALASTGAGRGAFSGAGDSLAQASPRWLVVAGIGFAAALLCSAAAWHSGLQACGARAGFTQVSARYAVGSLVNSFAPAHLGGAVRLALLSQTLPGEDRLWRAGGVGGAVAAARALALAALVVVAAGWGKIPLWPAPLLAIGVLVAVVICARVSRRVAGRLGSLLQIFRALAASPRAAARLSAWIAVSFSARIGAAIALAAAFGVPGPVWVAFVLVTAIALAGVAPVTPGNFGAGAGAATLALHGTGVGLSTALAIGVAFQAVETFAAVTLGLAGAATLASPGSRVRRFSLAVAGASAVLVAAVLGVISVELVSAALS